MQFLSPEFTPETMAHLEFSLADDLHLDDPPIQTLLCFLNTP
jgi:hypothetical protein